LFGSKKKKKSEEDLTDRSTDAFKKLNQKEIEELSNEVTESRNKMAKLAVAHEKLETQLETAVETLGVFDYTLTLTLILLLFRKILLLFKIIYR
jgi:hypothetical protein